MDAWNSKITFDNHNIFEHTVDDQVHRTGDDLIHRHIPNGTTRGLPDAA